MHSQIQKRLGNSIYHVKILVSQADPDVIVLTESLLKKSVNDLDVAINDYTLPNHSCFSVSLLHVVSVRNCSLLK